MSVDPIEPALPTSSPDESGPGRVASPEAPSFGRRGLLSRGALMAGAAAGAMAVVARPDVAQAADGDSVKLGAANVAETTTSVTVGGDTGSAQPTLSLANADGPSLKLQPLAASWSGQLEVGEMVGTELGPLVGVDLPSGATTTYLVTGADLANVPTPFATTPFRALDLRTAAGRNSIIRRSSATALAADGRLRAGQWIDVGLVTLGDDYALQAVFANLTVVAPKGNGRATVYPPGVQPSSSSINYVKNQTLANFAFVACGVVQGYHTIRLYSTAEAWFLIDVSGGVNIGNTQTPLIQSARSKGGRLALIRKVRAALARRVR